MNNDAEITRNFLATATIKHIKYDEVTKKNEYVLCLRLLQYLPK